MTPTYYLLLSALLFCIGAVGVLIRRNAIVVFMCIELMLNAVNLTLVTFSRINGDLEGQVQTLKLARLIVASTYIFSGLQKLNLNFIDNDFPWLVQPITNVFPSAAGLLHGFGFAVPFVQVAFGIGLLTRRYRRGSLILAVAMHLFILAMFGPAGLDWNNIVWPWTAAMAIFDIILFSNPPEFSGRKFVSNRPDASTAGMWSLSCARGSALLVVSVGSALITSAHA